MAPFERGELGEAGATRSPRGDDAATRSPRGEDPGMPARGEDGMPGIFLGELGAAPPRGEAEAGMPGMLRGEVCGRGERGDCPSL
mmetsp:Transcript_96030/g.166763  ORF Transcript_96030/g.166763 Transcript_96030/m.166763 type:complete len:85 (-) Transcript_96030:35-289(-)